MENDEALNPTIRGGGPAVAGQLTHLGIQSSNAHPVSIRRLYSYGRYIYSIHVKHMFVALRPLLENLLYDLN